LPYATSEPLRITIIRINFGGTVDQLWRTFPETYRVIGKISAVQRFGTKSWLK
jgi:hypothetical protein